MRQTSRVNPTLRKPPQRVTKCLIRTTSIARVLLDAAASGERDPERLKNAALSESAFVKRSRWSSSPELATRSL